VTRIGLGAMLLSLEGRPDRAAAKAVIRRAVEGGITLIDTADAYALDDTEIGHNERLIAEALGEMRLGAGADSPVLVATKGGYTRPGGAWKPDGRPERLRAACHASLVALGVERIGLYQLHAPDPRVPFAESVGEIARLREEGKVELVGLSNVSVDQIEIARAIVPIASVQNQFSPWDAGYRRSSVVEHCRRHGIVFLAYSPLGGRRRAALLAASAPLAKLARELEASPHELALAWLLEQAPVVVPIPSATRTESVDGMLRAASLDLHPADLASILRAFRKLPGSRGLAARVVGRIARALGA
jgi:aryl-alcohol dehydrogenase-like predicted oxidoreductase